MKCTSNIFHTTKRELYYQWHSKKIIIVFFILLALSIAHLVGLYGDIISAYDRYKTTENSYMENGIDIIEALEKPNDTYIEGNVTFVNNPMVQPKPINEIIGITIPVVSVVVLLMITFGIAKKRSSYS